MGGGIRRNRQWREDEDGTEKEDGRRDGRRKMFLTQAERGDTVGEGGEEVEEGGQGFCWRPTRTGRVPLTSADHQGMPEGCFLLACPLRQDRPPLLDGWHFNYTHRGSRLSSAACWPLGDLILQHLHLHHPPPGADGPWRMVGPAARRSSSWSGGRFSITPLRVQLLQKGGDRR